MKFYLASSFSLIDHVDYICNALETEGHEVTVKWWKRIELKNKFQVLEPDDFYDEPECRFAFTRDFKGIAEADALIMIAAKEPRSYNGANIEIGIAYGLGKPVFSLGNLTNSALYLGVTRCKTIEDILDYMTNEFKNKPKCFSENPDDSCWCILNPSCTALNCYNQVIREKEGNKDE